MIILSFLLYVICSPFPVEWVASFVLLSSIESKINFHISMVVVMWWYFLVWTYGPFDEVVGCRGDRSNFWTHWSPICLPLLTRLEGMLKRCANLVPIYSFLGDIKAGLIQSMLDILYFLSWLVLEVPSDASIHFTMTALNLLASLLTACPRDWLLAVQLVLYILNASAIWSLPFVQSSHPSNFYCCSVFPMEFLLILNSWCLAWCLILDWQILFEKF